MNPCNLLQPSIFSDRYRFYVTVLPHASHVLSSRRDSHGGKACSGLIIPLLSRTPFLFPQVEYFRARADMPVFFCT